VTRFLCSVLLVALFPGAALALEVTASVDPDKGRVGEEMVLTVVVSGSFRNLSDPVLPNLSDDFDVYSAGSSRNFSFINGRTSSSLSLQYRLVPKRVGTFTIGPIQVEHDKEVVSTRPITVQVFQAPPPPEPKGDDAAQSVTGGNQDLFVRASVDKQAPFLFEQVTYTLSFYTRVGLLESPQLSQPSTQGFWREDLPASDAHEAVVDGVRYQVSEVSFALFPTTPGKLTVGEAVLDCNVRVRSRNRDPFSMFGGGLYEGKRVQLRTDPLTVNVKPLPPGAPPGFDGAVGDYVLEVSADKTEVTQNDAVVLTVAVNGNGNLRTVPEIKLPNLSEFRTYPQSSKQQMKPDQRTVGGFSTQEFVLVPLTAGVKTIPPIELATFSPRAGAYRVLQSKPITLHVTPATAGAVVPGNTRAGIEVVGRDIRFIETSLPRFMSAGSELGRARTWLFLYPLPVFAYAGVWWWDRRRRRLGADVALRRRSRAARDARRRLKESKVDGAAGRAAEAAAVIRGYCADLWNVPAAGLTADALAERLQGMGVDPAPLVSLLDGWDAARFAPVSADGHADPLAHASEWVDRLEKAR